MGARERAVAERGIDRKRHGNSSALGHRNSSCYRTKVQHRCTGYMCRPRRRSSEWPRCRRCRDYCRRSWGCGSADSGCALGSGCETMTEVRNLRSPCRGCRHYTQLRARHRRNHHQRRSCRCLSIVPPTESGCEECGYVESGDGVDGGHADSGHAENDHGRIKRGDRVRSSRSGHWQCVQRRRQ